MTMTMTNCPNCGAVRETAERRCPYCGTPYPKDRMAAAAEAVPVSVPESVVIELSPEQFARLQILEEEIARAIITPNQARRLMGLPPV